MNKTDSERVWPHPADFRVGSDESRAAARAFLHEREKGVRRIQIVSYIPRPRQDNLQPRVGSWSRIDGGFMRVVYVPPSTGEEAKRRILATP